MAYRLTHEIKYLSCCHQVMQTVHNFFHTGGPVPPVQVQNIDVVCAEFLERCFHRDMHRFDVVPNESYLLLVFLGSTFEVGGVLVSERMIIRKKSADDGSRKYNGLW